MERHGVTVETQKRMLIDAGAVYIGDPETTGSVLAATKGGNVFEINRTIRRTDPDGAIGPVKGFKRREEIVATLTANLLEITEANLLKALPGSSATSHVITGGEIDDADYIDLVCIVGTITDPDLPPATKPIILKLKNCLVEGPLSLNLNPKDEAVLVMKFTAHFDPADLDAEPWEIKYPSAT